MKQIISTFLVFTILLSSMGITSFAKEKRLETGRYTYIEGYDLTVLPQPHKLDEKIENQIKDDYVLSQNYRITADSVTVEYYGTLSNGAYLLKIYSKEMMGNSSIDYFVMGSYVYVTGNSMDHITVYDSNGFTLLFDAYTSGQIDDELMDEVAAILNLEVNPKPYDYIYGDVNLDSNINIKDVTEILSAAVELTAFDNIQTILGDVDKDGVITVKDATTIQKYICEYAYEDLGITGQSANI